MKPEHHRAAGDRPGHRHRSPGPGQRTTAPAGVPAAATSPAAASSTASGAGSGSGSGPASGSGGGAAPAPGSATASVDDARGDASGLGTPSYVDLTGATVTRTGDRFAVQVVTAGALPSRQTDDHTMNVVCFVDTDGDGQVDDEMWASLSDSGWSTSYRYPDGARFGADSGVSVRVQGDTLTLGFAASAVGGARSFRWAVGDEWGTLEQVASGTTAQDLAPDRGAARFPG